MAPFSVLVAPKPYLFFTGKGGVGKTSLSCASAIALADRGLRVLLVSTDPASNLDEMLGVELAQEPRPVPGVPRLFAMNIDPEDAAAAYRLRVLAQMDAAASQTDRAKVLPIRPAAPQPALTIFGGAGGAMRNKVDQIGTASIQLNITSSNLLSPNLARDSGNAS
jgi:hypothetical protein